MDANRAVGIVWLVLTVPVFVVGTRMYWSRRHVQPIKARLPKLCIAGSVACLAFTIFGCFKLIFWDTYPCILALWQDFLFSVFIFQIYLVRCYILFFKFEVTAERMRLVKENLARSASDAEYSQLCRRPPTDATDMAKAREKRSTLDAREAVHALASFHTNSANSRNSIAHAIHSPGPRYPLLDRIWLGSPRFLVCVLVVLAAAEMLAIVLVTADDDNPSLARDRKCSRDHSTFSATIAVFVSFYLACFILFATKLRRRLDGFRIKMELKMSAIMAAVMFVLWMPWIYVPVLRDWNDKHFLVSTTVAQMFLLCLFIMSTLWPVYLTLDHQPLSLPLMDNGSSSSPMLSRGVSSLRLPLMKLKHAQFSAKLDNISLTQLLAIPEGLQSFIAFLATEFSVENGLFWNHVHEYQNAFRFVSHDPKGVKRQTDDRGHSVSSASADGADALSKDDLVEWAHDLYETYIKRDSPMELNLPADIIREIDRTLGRNAWRNDSRNESIDRQLSRHGDVFTVDEEEEEELIEEKHGPMGGAVPGGDSASDKAQSEKKKKKKKKNSKRKIMGMDSNSLSSMNSYFKLHSALFHVFDRAVQNIEQLMDTDSFVRYRDSPFFTELKLQLREKVSNEVILVEMGLDSDQTPSDLESASGLL